jgi:N-acetylglucosaminyl-diphospho-decaprenol L-rhamnosyltransferase
MRSPARASRCCVVSVCYQSDAVAGEMVASIPSESRVVLVDNSPKPSSFLQRLANERHGLYFHNQNNIGFGAACNQGALASSEEYVLFLNPDARLEPGSLNQLIQALDDNPQAVAANPRITTNGQKIQFKHRSALLTKREWHAKRPPTRTAAVPVLHGSALIVRRQSFCEVGGFDETIFLYHEDDDLSIRLRQAGGLLLWVPEASAHHLSGHSSPRSAQIAFEKAYRMAQSRIYTMRKHGFRHAKRSTIFSALFQLIGPASLISRRKRMKARGFLQGALEYTSGKNPN